MNLSPLLAGLPQIVNARVVTGRYVGVRSEAILQTVPEETASKSETVAKLNPAGSAAKVRATQAQASPMMSAFGRDFRSLILDTAAPVIEPLVSGAKPVVAAPPASGVPLHFLTPQPDTTPAQPVDDEFHVPPQLGATPRDGEVANPTTPGLRPGQKVAISGFQTAGRTTVPLAVEQSTSPGVPQLPQQTLPAAPLISAHLRHSPIVTQLCPVRVTHHSWPGSDRQAVGRRDDIILADGERTGSVVASQPGSIPGSAEAAHADSPGQKLTETMPVPQPAVSQTQPQSQMMPAIPLNAENVPAPPEVRPSPVEPTPVRPAAILQTPSQIMAGRIVESRWRSMSPSETAVSVPSPASRSLAPDAKSSDKEADSIASTWRSPTSASQPIAVRMKSQVMSVSMELPPEARTAAPMCSIAGPSSDPAPSRKIVANPSKAAPISGSSKPAVPRAVPHVHSDFAPASPADALRPTPAMTIMPIAPAPPAPQVVSQPTLPTSDPDGDPVAGSPVPPATQSVPAMVTSGAVPVNQPVAFRARVTPRDASENPPRDSFARRNVVKQGAPLFEAEIPTEVEPAPAVHETSGSSQPVAPHRDTLRPLVETTIHAPEPGPVSHALNAAEPMVHISADPVTVQPTPDTVLSDPAPPAPAAQVVEPPLSDAITHAKSLAPIHDLSLRLTSDSQEVEVKLTDRGGELHVAVKSADPVLTSDLRAGLHELVGGLESGGFHAEAWHGTTTHLTSGSASETSRNNFRDSAENPTGSGTNSQPQSGHDASRQGRNAYEPVPAAARRNRAANAVWLSQFNAANRTEKES